MKGKGIKMPPLNQEMDTPIEESSVNANRLENFIFDNLARISNDKIYIENLIFRLNNDPEVGYRSGHERAEVCSPLSSQILQNLLKIFLKSLAQQKGVERNLLIKKFIKDIIYSKEQIQINLYYSEDFDALKNSILSSGVGVSGYKKEKGTSVSSSENLQFVLFKMAPNARLGIVDENPIRDDMEEAGRMAGVDFIFNVVRNRKNEVVRAVAGDLVLAQRGRILSKKGM